ncbi:NUDIX domain-containing protein [Streptomyces sp. NPDC023998]|uniref:NUDIX domain-containing protein n=1 Tax=Streptomyces sp. NPDC023998 TaxID=3154597 RepID=UPI0033C6511E
MSCEGLGVEVAQPAPATQVGAAARGREVGKALRPLLASLKAAAAQHLGAAQRELTEETGITASVVIPAGHRPVHIDAHQIPSNSAKGEPDHRHFDFRFLFRTQSDVVELQDEEVTAAAWRYADTIDNETLRARVLEALR